VTFEVGFVPNGWQRGQPLRVMRAKGAWPGFVSLDHTRLAPDYKLSADAVGLITLSLEDSSKIDPWLDWWNAAGG